MSLLVAAEWEVRLVVDFSSQPPSLPDSRLPLPAWARVVRIPFLIAFRLSKYNIAVCVFASGIPYLAADAEWRRDLHFKVFPREWQGGRTAFCLNVKKEGGGRAFSTSPHLTCRAFIVNCFRPVYKCGNISVPALLYKHRQSSPAPGVRASPGPHPRTVKAFYGSFLTSLFRPLPARRKCLKITLSERSVNETRGARL